MVADPGQVQGLLQTDEKGQISTPVEPDGGNVGFSLNREDTPKVIAHLQRALELFRQAAREAVPCENPAPPGNDPHSAQAIQRICREFTQNYLTKNTEKQEYVRTLIANIETAMRDYDARDGDSARDFGRKV